MVPLQVLRSWFLGCAVSSADLDSGRTGTWPGSTTVARGISAGRAQPAPAAEPDDSDEPTRRPAGNPADLVVVVERLGSAVGHSRRPWCLGDRDRETDLAGVVDGRRIDGDVRQRRDPLPR